MCIVPFLHIRSLVYFITPTIAFTWYRSSFVIELDWMNLGMGIGIAYGKQKASP